MATLDWNGLLTSGLNAFLSGGLANANTNAASDFANATKFNPYNVSTPNANVSFNGNNATASLNPQYAGLQSQLTSGASGLLGNFQSSNYGIPDFLQNEYNTANANGGNPNVSGGLGTQYNNTASGFLGSLGSFNPTTAASDYTNNLRQQALPQNQQTTQSMFQNLFNTGRLGSTGGANIAGALQQAQNQQDLQFQQAGRDYAGQEQNRLAGLAQSFGQQGTALNQQDYTNVNNRANQRFMNAMQLFGAGQSNQQNQLGLGLGMLQGSQGLDQNLLQSIGLGGNLGAAQSNTNQNAYQNLLMAQVAKNNTLGAGGSSLLNSLLGNGSSGSGGGLGGILGSLLGGNSGSSGGGLGGILGSLLGNNSLDGVGSANYLNDAVYGDGGNFTDWLSGVLDSNPSAAGGEAAASGASAASGATSGALGATSGSLADGVGLNDAAGLLGAAYTLYKPQGKFSGALSGAMAGNQLGGWPGAIIGGALGYARNGGVADADPTDMAKTSIPEAWQNQDLARLAGSPAAALADKLGAGSGVVNALDKLDPFATIGHAFGGGQSKKRNWNTFNQLYPGTTVNNDGNYVLPSPFPQTPITQKQLDDLTGTWYGAAFHPDGDQEGWTKKFQDSLSSIYGLKVPDVKTPQRPVMGTN